MQRIKYAEYKAGLTIAVIIIYFLLFSFLAMTVSDVEDDLGFASDTDTSNNGIFNNIYNNLGSHDFAYCDSPRYRYDIQEAEPYQLSKARENNLRCDYTNGIYNQITCENYSGCGWENTTSSTGWSDFLCGFTLGLLGCSSSDPYYTCLGFINSSVYGINSSGIGNSSRYVTTYHYEDFLGMSDEYDLYVQYKNLNDTNIFGGKGIDQTDNSICTHPIVLMSQPLCDMFSCTWVEETISPKTSVVSATMNIFSAMGKVLTFNFDFGFSTGVNLFLYLILVLIPFIILIVSIIYAFVG